MSEQEHEKYAPVACHRKRVLQSSNMATPHIAAMREFNVLVDRFRWPKHLWIVRHGRLAAD
jgi:hypothetical protein